MPNINTLRGVFPEPVKIPKRNFIKENMVSIKNIQSVGEANRVRSAQARSDLTTLESDEKNKSIRTIKLIQSTRKQLQGLQRLSNACKSKPITQSNQDLREERKKHHHHHEKTAVEVFKDSLKTQSSKEIGVQTEQFNNVKQLYEHGTIIYPSDCVISVTAHHKNNSGPLTTRSPERSPKSIEDCDYRFRKSDKLPESKSRSTETPIAAVEKKHDFVKENAQVVKSLAKPVQTNRDPTLVPVTYQKGVVPKYLQERKDLLSKQAQSAEGDERCPEGHVALPENERKETLRMLKQSYMELITELNMLPVRSDTLKIRNRKVEIETQLRKLDEGIKVFSRPKVYVKIGA